MELTIVQKIAVYALPILFAITVHEAAHGYAAKYFGDLTAEKLGRITLNPLKHIDPFGTILLPALTVMLGGILFGWAKPVPVNFANLNNPKKDMFWVAAAGPASNFVMAIMWAILLNYANYVPNTAVNFLAEMSLAGISINLVLMVLNLLPMPPLDGGRIAVSLLPTPWAIQLARLEQYGFIILIVLMFTGILGKIISPIIQMFERLIYVVFM
ncbi:MAG: site-2 protease family protein [Methylophilaceae bacterium 17-43-7]|nr:MAG: site-2 protease family protein [Methylophilales bacterium 28-44-11]OYZ04005.1 MAG: site-2 protease family protein [Methylophilales bacterium 16-45-7]OYZ68715.1 MAG: site-2 protease family protein [Methylophilaceae bacterium 17-43-7]